MSPKVCDHREQSSVHAAREMMHDVMVNVMLKLFTELCSVCCVST